MTRNITVQKILGILLHRIRLIIISTLAFGLIFFLYTNFFITPMYSTSSMIFVQNYNKASEQQERESAGTSSGDAQSNLSAGKIYYSDINGSNALANICVILFKNSEEVTSLYNGCNVSISTEANTFYINIVVSGSDPQKCANVANQIADICGNVYHSKFDFGQIGVIRKAYEPTAPYYPNKLKNTLIGAAIGFVAACLLAVLLELIDITIKPDEDLSEIYKIPVFAEIPDFENSGR